MAAQIRDPIQRCIDYVNQEASASRRIQWTNRQLRDPGSCALLISYTVPEAEAHMVQIRHVDFFGFQRKFLSCHIGLSDGIRLQIYDEDKSRWLEVTYGRGDILLVRGHKFHRGTNHSDPDPKIRSFIYIEDEEYHQELLSRRFAEKGAVFSAGLKDLDGWYKREYKLENDSRATSQKEAREAAKSGRTRKLEALAKRSKQPQDDSTESP